MPLSALALVLLAALLHASWNFAAKQAGGDQRFTLITSLLTSLLQGGLASFLAHLDQFTLADLLPAPPGQAGLAGGLPMALPQARTKVPRPSSS